MELKNLIKTARITKQLSTTELAKMVGVSQSTISRWERGDIATMKQSKVVLLSKALGITPNEILDMPMNGQITYQEQMLLSGFRKLGEQDKKVVFEMFTAIINKMVGKI